MNSYVLSHLSDSDLSRDLLAQNNDEFCSTARLLAYIAEFDARKLYVPAGYPSMFAYCLRVLRRTEEATYKRIHAARAAQRFPAIFAMVADGRLHLSGVVLLAPHLTEENAGELVATAANRTKGEVEELIAARFPRLERPDRVRVVHAAQQHAPGRVEGTRGDKLPTSENALGLIEAAPTPATLEVSAEYAPWRVEGPREPAPESHHTPHPARVAPVSAERFEVRVTVSRGTRDKMRYAQRLLGQHGYGDLALAVDRAFDALIAQIENRKFGATDRPHLATLLADAAP